MVIQLRVLFILFQYLTVVKITFFCYVCVGSSFSAEVPKVSFILKRFPTVHLFFSDVSDPVVWMKAQQTKFCREYSSWWSSPRIIRWWKSIKTSIIINLMASLERLGDHCMRYRRIMLHFAFCSTATMFCVVQSRTSALPPPSSIPDHLPLKLVQL